MFVTDGLCRKGSVITKSEVRLLRTWFLVLIIILCASHISRACCAGNDRHDSRYGDGLDRSIDSRRKHSGQEYRHRTDEGLAKRLAGPVRIADLLVGDYEVQASKAGFATLLHRGITLIVGSQNVVDFSLAVGQQAQTVTVEGPVTQVETTSSTVTTLVDQTQMRELPLNGRTSNN